MLIEITLIRYQPSKLEFQLYVHPTIGSWSSRGTHHPRSAELHHRVANQNLGVSTPSLQPNIREGESTHTTVDREWSRPATAVLGLFFSKL